MKDEPFKTCSLEEGCTHSPFLSCEITSTFASPCCTILESIRDGVLMIDLEKRISMYRKTTEKAKTIIVIDGCQNSCATKILEKDGIAIHKTLNLVHDLKIPKVVPFKPFDFKQEDMDKTVGKIIELCEG